MSQMLSPLAFLNFRHVTSVLQLGNDTIDCSGSCLACSPKSEFKKNRVRCSLHTSSNSTIKHLAYDTHSTQRMPPTTYTILKSGLLPNCTKPCNNNCVHVAPESYQRPFTSWWLLDFYFQASRQAGFRLSVLFPARNLVIPSI